MLLYIKELKLIATHCCPEFCPNTNSLAELYGAVIVLLRQLLPLRFRRSFPDTIRRHARSPAKLTPTDQNDFFSHEELFEIRSKAASVKNFAVHLTRMLFQPEELRGRNVRGVAGKQPLNPDKVKVIMDAVCKFYPAPPEGRDFQWRDCRKAVDTYLRGIKFSERNQ